MLPLGAVELRFLLPYVATEDLFLVLFVLRLLEEDELYYFYYSEIMDARF